MTGVLVILAAVAVLAMILRVGTAALVVSGLSREVARFQVRSAFFGVGFTTSEAEVIVNHPFRRKLVQALMLLGAVGITSVIGSGVLTFARSDNDSVLLPILVLAGGLAVLWALASWKPLDHVLTRFFERVLRRYTTIDTQDYQALLRLSGEYTIRRFQLRPDGVLVGRSIAELLPEGRRVVLLGIERADGTYLGAPPLETVLQADDMVTVYGRDEVLEGFRGRAANVSP